MNGLTVIVTVMNEMAARTSSSVPVAERSERVTFASGDRAYVYAVARRIVGSSDAEDVTQDALVLAYRYRDSFRGDSRYRTWLHRIVVTTALGHLRRQRRSRIDVVDPGQEHGVLERSVDPAKSPVTLIAEAEDRATVQRALAELPSSYRDVLLERVDAAEPDVAARLGISVANVKIRAHRARKQLRHTLGQMDRSAA